MRFKTIRIFLLTLLFIFVALYTYEQKRASTSWLKPIELVIYPLNPSGSKKVDQYISQLKDKNFTYIDYFLQRESKKYDLILSKPTKTRLGQTIKTLPPKAPKPGDGMLSVILWSMKFRYWAWQNTPDDQSNLRRARMFVLYHEVKDGIRLEHSYGLNKGLLGYVNAFAAKQQQAQNNVVIAHEFLHTVGAKDKYGTGGQPAYPEGYARPNAQKRYPQKRCEIMAGRIPLSATESKMPKSLKSCVINNITAKEIHWLKTEG